MAQYNITVDDELLKGLFSGDKGISQLLEQVLNQVLHAQASEQLHAKPYERSDDRQGYRNGTRPHPLTTRVGALTLRVPRLRNGNFSTELFARYQRSEQALLLALVEMVIQGVSTRKITAITEELYCTEPSSRNLPFRTCVSDSTRSWRHGMDTPVLSNLQYNRINQHEWITMLSKIAIVPPLHNRVQTLTQI